MKRLCLSAVLIALPAACADKSDADSIAGDLEDFASAAHSLQAASPSRAWDPVKDAGAIVEMQDQWKRMRTAYEHVEGAIVALFPGVDVEMDGRYEQGMALMGIAGDQDLFDDVGVTGMHAVERILYAPRIRPEVVTFERRLAGYKPAAYPATDDEAISFKSVLVQLLIEDAASLKKRWQPTAVDIGAAYVGLVGLMDEQKEKVSLAATGEEESRYANITLFDLRCNLEGTKVVYDLFREWIHSKSSGANSDSVLRDKFSQLETLYGTTAEALPAAPLDWNPKRPTDDNLATPYGTLWKHVHESVDAGNHGSVVDEMNRIAGLLGLPAFVEPR